MAMRQIVGESPALLDFPLYSNHVQIQEADMSYRFHGGSMGLVAGDAKVMRKTADDLDVMRDGAIKTYLSKARNMKRRDLVKMLDEETWIGADRAVELGFADEVLEPVRVAALARFKLENYFQHIPEPVSRIQNDERNKQAQRRAHIERLKSK